MYHIVICDDNTEYISFLKKVIVKIGMGEEPICFYEFETGEALVDYINRNNAECDLLILDVQLPGINGERAAEIFREKFSDAVLVFCSGTCMPTDISFKVRAYRYLFKYYSDDKMTEEMKEVLEEVKEQKKEPSIIGHCRFQAYQLKPKDILYIEISRRGSRIYVCPSVEFKGMNGKLLSDKKLDILYEILKEYDFAYAHNSYIVNLRYIRKITTKELIFVKFEEEEEIKLSISRSRSKELREIFAKMAGKKY